MSQSNSQSIGVAKSLRNLTSVFVSFDVWFMDLFNMFKPQKYGKHSGSTTSK